MDSQEFKRLRAELSKTQNEMAQLLGTSLKAVHSYEQGWRKVPGHVERQMLFLLACQRNREGRLAACWKVKHCPPETRRRCPAWEFQVGGLCWFVNGTICEGVVYRDWQEKMKVCRQCEVLRPLLGPPVQPED
ncbi:MAG: transcriptional regulator [Desulfarculus sp.]|nr:MAG: transcriptional regulator [Desulfarculus sp.]